jgi:hypothetical protein
MKKIIVIMGILSINLAIADDNPFEFKETVSQQTYKPSSQVGSPGMDRNMPPGMPGGAPIIDDFMSKEQKTRAIMNLTPNDFLILTINGKQIYHNAKTDKYTHVTEKEIEQKLKESGNAL